MEDCSPKVEDLAHQATDLLAAREYPKALTFFDELLAANPMSLKGWLGKAACKAGLGEKNEALKICGDLLKIENSNTTLRKLIETISEFPISKINSLQDPLPAWAAVQEHKFGIPLYRLRGATLVGKNGIILTADNTLLRESTVADDMKDISAQEAISYDCYHVATFAPGSYMCLYGFRSRDFFHWLIEWLPRVIVAEAAGFDGLYVIPSEPPKYIRESLALLAISPARIREHTAQNWKPEHLYLAPTLPFHRVHEKPEVVMELRSRLREASSDTILPSSGSVRIHVSRRNAARRKVLNQARLESLLSRYGFSHLCLEEYPLKEQIALISRARVLAGPHGAGMAHALFMNENSLMIECFRPLYVNTCMTSIARLLGHRYHMIVSQVCGPVIPPQEEVHTLDIHADLDLLELVLASELKEPARGC